MTKAEMIEILKRFGVYSSEWWDSEAEYIFKLADALTEIEGIIFNPETAGGDYKEPPPSEGVDDGDTVAVQKQTDGSYHLACQNCGTTKQPLQMIPFRNDNHVVGLLTACDECRDELYGQRFDRETKFPHPSEQERYVKQALDMVIEEEQRLSQERYDKGKSHLLRFYNSHEISQAHWDALKIASGKK